MTTPSTAELPKTMRAWYAQRRGNPGQVLALKEDYPMPPDPVGDDLLVKVSHAALNPADIIATQLLPTWIPFLKNRIPGMDFSGTVVKAGSAAGKEFPPGTEVCASMGLGRILKGKGALAEFVAIPSSLVAAKPKSLGFAEAAGMGVTGQTAAMMLKEAKVKPGDKVLINGGSGGVGTMLVQVVHNMGAHVTATCSEGNIPMVKRIGADEVIDYRAKAPLHQYLKDQKLDRPFDYILDTVRTQELYDNSPSYLKPKGLYINIGAHGTQWQQLTGRVKGYLVPTWLGGTPRKYMSMGLLPNGKLQREVADWANAGLLKEVPIDSELAMEDVLQGFAKIESQHAKGKVIIRVAKS